MEPTDSAVGPIIHMISAQTTMFKHITFPRSIACFQDIVLGAGASTNDNNVIQQKLYARGPYRMHLLN